MLTESGVVQNPCAQWQVSICSVWLSLWEHILFLYFWPLPSNFWLLFSLFFFLFLSSFLFVFLCLLFVRQFSSPSCGSSTGNAQSSLNYVVIVPPSSARFISSALSWPVKHVYQWLRGGELIKLDWEAPVNILKGRAARDIHRGRLVKWADRSLMKGGPDRQQAERAKVS